MKWALPACLAAYGVLTALLIFSVPINTAPDEAAHLEYVHYLWEKQQLPIFQAKGANFPGYEFHQPPLYYALCAATWTVLPASAQPYAARLLSLVCGMGTLVFLWHSLRLLFSDNEQLAPLATGFAALWPLHIGVGASAGNDALAGVLCAALFWSVTRMAKRTEYSVRDALWVGVFFGLGMLAKSSCLTVGIAALGAMWHITRQRCGPRVALTSTLLAITATLLLCGAWLIRNQVLYGDPLAARIFDEAFKNSSPRPQAVMAATGVNFLEYLRAYFVVLFATCWGFFGGPNTAIRALNPFGHGMSPSAFEALPFMLICIAATVVAKFGFFKWLVEKWRGLECATRCALVWWGVGMMLVCAALLRFNFIQFQAQARYLHPALLPMSLLLALGWQRSLGLGKAGRMGSAFFACVLIFITLWNIFGWRTLV